MKEISNYFLKAVIDRFEDKEAVIRTEDGQELLWPIKNLPEDCEAGSVLRLVIRTNETEQQEEEKLAKNLLNEILKNK